MEKLFELNTSEDRKLIRQQVLSSEINAISKKIKEVAKECSEITSKLDSKEVSDAERQALAEKLEKLVEEGTILANRRNTACAQVNECMDDYSYSEGEKQ